MKSDWIELIGEKIHEVWMELYAEREGEEKAKEHSHYKPWNELISDTEAVNQDRFVASVLLRSLVRGDLKEKEDVPCAIHNGVQLWVRLTGEKLKAWHVPYLQSGNQQFNERMKKERETQAEAVWPVLQKIATRIEPHVDISKFAP